MPEQLADALVLVRDAARACLSAYPKESDGERRRRRPHPGQGSVQEVFVTAERMAADLESDVLWLAEGGDRFPPRLCVAPLEVWGPMRDKLLTDKTVVFTSATLMLGGDFSAVATSVGLKPAERSSTATGRRPTEADDDAAVAGPRRRLAVRLRPAGDPLRRPPPAAARPRRAGRGASSTRSPSWSTPPRAARSACSRRRRAAETAAEAVRERLPHLTTLAQGDAQLPELARQFVEDPHTCLFGTLSLWQGLDVPGDTCQLVIIDRIPFPRPDDPLDVAPASARSTRPAATASCRSPPPTPRCCWPRAPAG